ncbi:hypothetical protein [Hydrocarboniphaga sp.]|uniref:hypothetical protein n=1 Tax=Hydrocarboniphaga sp. TaxID=2033016 RepID=UPI0026190D00|nr:hypothetical protein [Hydrocarboniphaga sp.]
MKKIRIGFFFILAFFLGCKNSLQDLRERTDINLNIPVTSVVLLHEEELDQFGFELNLTDAENKNFLSELGRVSGEKCVEYVMSNDGCAYRSAAGHDVFVLQHGLFKYRIRTSG